MFERLKSVHMKWSHRNGGVSSRIGSFSSASSIHKNLTSSSLHKSSAMHSSLHHSSLHRSMSSRSHRSGHRSRH